MNRRQIIHWCHGQHAAAYYMDRTAPTRKRSLFEPPFSAKQRGDLLGRLNEIGSRERSKFRIVLSFKDGSQEWLAGKVEYKSKTEPMALKSSVRILHLFSSSIGIKPAIIRRLAATVLVDDLGYGIRINNQLPLLREQDNWHPQDWYPQFVLDTWKTVCSKNS